MQTIVTVAICVGVIVGAVSLFVLRNMQSQNAQAAAVDSYVQLQRTIADVEDTEARESLRGAAISPTEMGIGDARFVQIPLIVQYPVINGVVAAIGTFIVGCLAIIANSAQRHEA